MSDIQKNPQDSVDLVYLLPAYNETIGTKYIRVYVYDPNDAAVSGSPFSLTLVGNNYYSKLNAYQAGNSGTYKHIYEVYDDAAFTTKSAEFGQKIETVTVKIQSTTGLGSYRGGDVLVDLDSIKKLIKEEIQRVIKRVDKIQNEVDNGFKIELTSDSLKSVLEKLSLLETNLQQETKNNSRVVLDKVISLIGIAQQIPTRTNLDKVIIGIKRAQSLIIKNKFDKALMKPIYESTAEMELRLGQEMKQTRIDLVKILDTKTDDLNIKMEKRMIGVLSKLNESVRKKLKYTVDNITHLFLLTKRAQQNINIKLQDERK